MRPRLTSTTAGLAIGITAAVAIACATGAYFYSVHHFQTLIESQRRTALAQGELMRAALEHQMIENDRSLIERLVQTFGKEPGVANVTLLDRTGTVRYSSAPVGPASEFQLSSPTCQACHQFPPEHRGSSRIIETRGGTMLRTVIAFRNGPACQRCHDARRRINGIMILDLDAGELRASINHDLRWLVAGTGTLALVLIAAIALVFRLFVMRRLQRFEHTARLIAAGDLDRRVPADGADTISWLATEFNTMADSMTGLVTEVRSQRERLETVINSMDDGIVVLDADRRVIAANDGFLRRSGRGRADSLGCFCKDLAPGACSAQDCPTMACLATGERQVRICERRAADGTVRWDEVHASPVRGPSGELTQIVEVWRDISDRRAAEARLADSHRLASLGVLASGFSHELNTPLATVLMCVEGIVRDARDHAGDEEWTRIGESAAIARDQILRCKGITQHFLRLSRGQPAAGDIIDVQPVIASVARLIEPTARAHHVTIDSSPADGPVHVRADESELQHAIINLLLNAVQACGASGRVTLAASNGSTVVVRVSDNGCGIAPEHQKRIFEPFFSLRKGGTGLGLFLALNFVRRWGGDIVVDSSPGHGSVFEIRLPSMEHADHRTC